MSSERAARVEGTAVLDGLVEGRLPPEPGAAEALEGWARARREQGIPFELRIDGGRFGLLAGDRPLRGESFPAGVAAAVEGALQELVDLLPRELRRELSSTVRCEEYARGQALQTLFAIQGGRVAPLQRAVEVETRPAARAPSPRVLLWGGWALALAVIAVWSVLSFAPGLLGLGTAGVTLEAGAFGRWIEVGAPEAASGGAGLRLALERGLEFPANTDARRLLLDSTDADLDQRLAAESLARGWARLEYLDASGRFLGASELRLAGLYEAQHVVLELPPPPPGARRARLAP